MKLSWLASTLWLLALPLPVTAESEQAYSIRDLSPLSWSKIYQAASQDIIQDRSQTSLVTDASDARILIEGQAAVGLYVPAKDRVERLAPNERPFARGLRADSFQAKSSEDVSHLTRLSESQQRIESMASLYEALFQSKDLLNIDFREFIASRTIRLSRPSMVPGVSVLGDVCIDHVALDLEFAWSLGRSNMRFRVGKAGV